MKVGRQSADRSAENVGRYQDAGSQLKILIEIDINCMSQAPSGLREGSCTPATIITLNQQPQFSILISLSHGDAHGKIKSLATYLHFGACERINSSLTPRLESPAS